MCSSKFGVTCLVTDGYASLHRSLAIILTRFNQNIFPSLGCIEKGFVHNALDSHMDLVARIACAVVDIQKIQVSSRDSANPWYKTVMHASITKVIINL